MRITDVKTVLLTGPSTGGDPFLLNVLKTRSASLVEIHTDTELVGIGETLAGYHVPEIVPEIVEFFKPILIGLEDDQINPRLLWQRMYRCANFWARVGLGAEVIAGIEGALWDLKGKMMQQPVYELLGGRLHDRLPCYATGCESPYPWGELLRKVDLYREAGFNAVKFGAGWYNHETGEDFVGNSVQTWVDMESEKVATLRKHVGNDFSIGLDGHMGNVDESKRAWDLATASAVLKALEPYDVLFFEEPLDYRDTSAYSELCRTTSIQVAGGEVLMTREEFQRFADARGFDIAQPDASIVGIWALLDIARMFAVQGKRLAPHGWASGPAIMQNIHAAFACPNIAILEIPPLPGGLHTDIYAEGYRFEDGYILPPETPGLGVRLTDQIKNKYPFVRGSGEWNLVPGKEQYL